MRRLTDALFPGARVFAQGFSGESALLMSELAADPERAKDVNFVAVQVSGIGRADFLAVIHGAARSRVLHDAGNSRRHARASGGSIGAGLSGHRAPHARRSVRRRFRASEPSGRTWVLQPRRIERFPTARLGSRRSTHRAHQSPDAAHARDVPRPRVRARCGDRERCASARVQGSATEVEKHIGLHVASLVQDGATLQFGIDACRPRSRIR